jgi:hypothetical protein
MSRKPNTAENVIRARVPKGVSGAEFRSAIKGAIDSTVYLTIWQAERLGTDTVTLRFGRAKIIKGAAR